MTSFARRQFARFITHDGHSIGTGRRVSFLGTVLGASLADAQRPRIRKPRPIARPLERQSIHPIVYGHAAADSLSAWRYASMLGTLRVSAMIHDEGTRISVNSISRMCPVSPIPPMVARKRSGSRS